MQAAGRVSEEKQYCYGPGRCTSLAAPQPPRPLPELSQWSSCSKECGGGKQWRARLCGEDSGDCAPGTTALIERECNAHPCEAALSCWADWSPCTGGRRSRTRSCAAGAVCAADEATTEEEECGWSAWGACRGGVQLRHGEHGDTQQRDCDEASDSGNLATRLAEDAGAGVNIIVGAAVIGFMLGSIVGAGLVYYYFKVKKNGGLNPPHYISAKSQNLYVSLPMLDLNKHKQLSSPSSDYSGTLRSTSGTLSRSREKTGSSVYGGKPGEYETATIKRSHSRRDSSLINNSSIRADLDSDNLFT